MIGLARPHAVIAADPGTPGARGGLASLMSTLFLVLGVSPLAGQFSASPVILEVRTSDGAGVEATEAVESTITVTNESEDRLQLRVYPADFDQAADGAHTFLEPGSHDRSCADRLEIFPASLVLDAGGSEVVRVRLMPGDSACWSMVFVQSVDRSEQGFRIAQRIGVKVYGVAAGVPSEG
ncbi:MAG TPA: hypothetical protein VK966_10145, partial [Longimicrobiales bacterium]|nr:hypothetical protein [Longimicrobiales bacterium]